MRNAGIVVVVLDLAIGDASAEMLLLADKLIDSILRLPLEGSKGLGYEARNADGYARRAAAMTRSSIELLDGRLRELRNSLDILVGLGGKSHHKVQLNCRITALKGGAAGA